MRRTGNETCRAAVRDWFAIEHGIDDEVLEIISIHCCILVVASPPRCNRDHPGWCLQYPADPAPSAV